MYTTKDKEKGFTIVELLIVIVVIAILAAISIVAFTGIQQRGRDTSRVSDASNIAKAMTAYVTDIDGGNGQWPESNTEAVEALEGYNSGIPSDVLDKMADSDTEPTYGAGENDVYFYVTCSEGGNVTGAEIRHWKEADGAGASDSQTAGSGC